MISRPANQTQRNLIIDRRLKGHTFREIAEELGISTRRVTKLYRLEVLKRVGGPQYDSLRGLDYKSKPKPKYPPRKPKIKADPWLE